MKNDRPPKSENDTVFALASAPGRAGVAVFRVSGPAAGDALERLCRLSSRPPPRTALLHRLFDPQTGEIIDQSVVLWFPAPHSYTGEDVAEFHVHGGRAVLNELTEALRRLPRFRLAEPGEFTRRAFENGKFDLTEAEAVADLVDAETTAQRRQALRQLEGELGRLYRGWAGRLKTCLAHMEADIDFTDDELPEDLAAQKTEEVRRLSEDIERHLDDRQRGQRLREGFMVAILGPPNAGKSSLLNALAQREAAIVMPAPGTTRDIIEVHLDLGGYPVTLADTAGLRESADAIESEGVRRALARAANADLKILVFDGANWPDMDETTKALQDDNTLTVVNKADLIANTQRQPDILFISATAGTGLREMSEQLVKAIDLRFASTGQPALTRARHRAALEECRDHLKRALAAHETELRAEDTRLAMRALGRITGSVDVEDLLDVVFKDFCIGK
ncbi:MAG: tRNA uridine-5-carboxymethylaminomethyl(34) synthesis GTPase MnmE [Alphaproteobacteria bacterium]|nr:tRNA uridine-5-carboxymethylaminomethyl(34) synthesis GTPase MnmE [Alphaproteobacteria bacterium]